MLAAIACSYFELELKAQESAADDGSSEYLPESHLSNQEPWCGKGHHNYILVGTLPRKVTMALFGRHLDNPVSNEVNPDCAFAYSRIVKSDPFPSTLIADFNRGNLQVRVSENSGPDFLKYRATKTDPQRS